MKGLITKAVGGFFFVSDNGRKIHQTKIRGRITEKVYPGDYVEFDSGVIENLYPRESLLFRPTIANIDQVLVVQSLAAPTLDKKLLDRFLVMVEAAALTPLIVINKIDLGDIKKLENEFKYYFDAGYQVFFVSVKNRIDINLLKRFLNKKINVLTGPSGVGKSSLINSLIKEVDLPTATVSRKLKRGVHTTRHVELLPIKEGGWVADTPGFTSLNINHIPPEELTYFFPEFIPFLNKCKFRGCSHTHEPGCAVKTAVDRGHLSSQRYDSYNSFYQEILDK